MKTTVISIVACSALLIGCGSDEASGEGSPPVGSRSVTQGGAQDIARFRSVVESGEVPAPDVLDPIGFFAEHALDQPPADCGRAVCAHPNLAVAPRFNGGNWTMAYVTLNSPIDPRDSHARPHAPGRRPGAQRLQRERGGGLRSGPRSARSGPSPRGSCEPRRVRSRRDRRGGACRTDRHRLEREPHRSDGRGVHRQPLRRPLRRHRRRERGPPLTPAASCS